MLFAIFCLIYKNAVTYYVALSTVLARIVSAAYNCAINYKLVFKSDEPVKKAIIRYAALVVAQMMASAILITCGVRIIKGIPEIVVKVIVDTCLFFVSYIVQRKFVF